MTGLEMLETISAQLTALIEKVTLIEANVKALNNRVNRLITGEQPIKQEQQQEISQAQPNKINVRVPEKPPQQKPQEVSNVVKSGRLVYKKVFGYLKNQNDQPIEEALVLIYNSKNEVCASAVSDPTGRWDTMLIPGRYVAECRKDNFPPVNKSFEFSENIKEHEVV